jgi:hypothetical protein
VDALRHGYQPAQPRAGEVIISDAAARLGVTKDWLYRDTGRLPYTVRLAERAHFTHCFLRFHKSIRCTPAMEAGVVILV